MIVAGAERRVGLRVGRSDNTVVVIAEQWEGNKKEYTDAQTQYEPAEVAYVGCRGVRHGDLKRNETYTGIREDLETAGVGVVKH